MLWISGGARATVVFVCLAMHSGRACATLLSLWHVVQGGPHKGWFRLGDKSTIMRVIYSAAQAYPSYVITFTKTNT